MNTRDTRRPQDGRNLTDVKIANQAAIFHAIHSDGPISRAALARRSGLHPATLTHIVSEFTRQGLVEEVGLGGSGRGRRSSLLSIRPQRGYIVAISLERLAIQGMLTDLDLRGTVRRTVTASSLSHPMEITLPSLLNLIRDLIRDSGIEREKIIGIGISSPGPLDNQRGVLISPPNFPGWPRVPLRRTVEKETGIATFLDNDANASALAEKWLGNGKGFDDFVYVLADTGVGGGIVANGEIYRGANQFAGEIGHMTIRFDGEPCGCGNVGCLENYASPWVAAELVRKAVTSGATSLAADLAGGRPENVSFEIVAQAAQQGDPVARGALSTIAQALAAGIVSVANAFDPQAILLGGRICLAGDLILEPLREIVARRAMSSSIRSVPVLVGALQRDAPLIGAACRVFQELFEHPEFSFAGQSFGPLPLHV